MLVCFMGDIFATNENTKLTFRKQEEFMYQISAGWVQQIPRRSLVPVEMRLQNIPPHTIAQASLNEQKLLYRG